MMARHSGGVPVPVPTIGERPSRDDVTPWETQQLEPEPESPSTAANADNTDVAAATTVRHKRKSRILSGSFFSRGS
jgi:hypothetical protein